MFKEMNVIKVFFENPLKEYSVRELARLVKIAPATASKNLKLAKELNLLKYRKEHNIDLYSANIENTYYRDLKVYYTIRKIRESGLIETLNIEYIKPTIILFGSASIGTDVSDSDIDLVLISEKTIEFKKRVDYEKKLGKELHLIIVKNLKEIKNIHLINNVLNGIVLQGEIKWISKLARKTDL